MTTLREDYDPNEIPLNSSAIHKVSPQLMELHLAEDMPGPGLEEVSEQGDYERRRYSRFDLPAAAAVVRLQSAVNKLVYRIVGNRKYQFWFAVTTLASIGLLVFTLMFRIEHIDDNLVALSELGVLETELLQIREVWSDEKMLALAESVERADIRRVFIDYRTLAIWLQQKSGYAEQLGLVFAYSLGPGRQSKIDGMLEVPIEVTLTAAPNASQTYLHVLEFLKLLVSTVWYVEIAEASLEGQGNGADRVRATLRVWVHGKVETNVAVSDVE